MLRRRLANEALADQLPDIAGHVRAVHTHRLRDLPLAGPFAVGRVVVRHEAEKLELPLGRWRRFLHLHGVSLLVRDLSIGLQHRVSSAQYAGCGCTISARPQDVVVGPAGKIALGRDCAIGGPPVLKRRRPRC